MYCPSSHCTINVETYAPSLQEVTIGGSPGALPAMVEQVYNGTAGEPKINTESKTGSTSALKHPSEDLRAEFAAKLKIQFANADHAEGRLVNSLAPTLPSRRGGAARFRGVTKHKRTQRFEAHIWDAKKQIYLGGFDSEIMAAMSHDIMAIRCKGAQCNDILNFSQEIYGDLMPIVQCLSRDDIVNGLRSYSKAQTAAKLHPVPHRLGKSASSRASRFGTTTPGIRKRYQSSNGKERSNRNDASRLSRLTIRANASPRRPPQKSLLHGVMEERNSMFPFPSQVRRDGRYDTYAYDSVGSESTNAFIADVNKIFQSHAGGQCVREEQLHPGAKVSPFSRFLRVPDSSLCTLQDCSDGSASHPESPCAPPPLSPDSNLCTSAPESPFARHTSDPDVESLGDGAALIGLEQSLSSSYDKVGKGSMNLGVSKGSLELIDDWGILNSFDVFQEEHQSLMYSSSSKSLLFESVTMDPMHTGLEHLTGAILVQDRDRSSTSASISNATDINSNDTMFVDSILS